MSYKLYIIRISRIEIVAKRSEVKYEKAKI